MEATIESVGYDPVFNAWKQLTQYQEVWNVSGRIIQDPANVSSSSAAQWMSGMIAELRAALLNMSRPRITMLHDDLTVSCFDIDPAQCSDGPTISNIQFPKSGDDVFTSGNNYSFQVTAVRNVGSSSNHGILEFQESLEHLSGGLVVDYVGGTINLAEKQIVKENEPWSYLQSGSAVGLYGYPIPPPPIYPQHRTRMKFPKLYAPEIAYPVQQRFKIEWSYEFMSDVALPNALPHAFYI